jgi:H+/Cl- antiporter ClcA
MGSFLPAAAVGAGLGYLGAAYLAPIFGLNDQQKKYFGIGSAALGAVLNTFTGKR